MFSFISNNWVAQPLINYETVLKFIRTTKTTAGLKIRALLTNKQYQKGLKISDQQMKHIALKRYTLRNETYCPETLYITTELELLNCSIKNVNLFLRER
jgi:hypothetical protein